MPAKLIWGNQSLQIILSGIVTGTEIRAYESQIWVDPRFDELRYVIWDGRDIEGWNVSASDLGMSVGYSVGHSYSNRTIRMALVMTDMAIYESGKQFVQGLASAKISWDVKLFQDMDLALDWLKA
jgi:hypothetical protein